MTPTRKKGGSKIDKLEVGPSWIDLCEKSDQILKYVEVGQKKGTQGIKLDIFRLYYVINLADDAINSVRGGFFEISRTFGDFDFDATRLKSML